MNKGVKMEASSAVQSKENIRKQRMGIRWNERNAE
jgi:hypothetical protein